ncbi:hypothetical protein J437_LFUL014601 [Ladona fulva]|uniref:Uncharacterized protein n=1 Tax=Ladona fulva TaxID=123851 RepID=A0A8K0KFZ6_LADFU|nr:hypothetical protein J437_LFUL014601 [Ladona fulva]
MIRLWEKFLEYVGKKVISQKRMTQYHKDVLIPLLEAGFLHHNIKLVELTKSLWNKTLGEQFSDVTIPPSLAEILENVLRDDTESEGPELMVVKQKPVSTSPFKCPVLQKNLHPEKKTLSSLVSTLSQGNGVEFVAISPRQKSSVLTDHQKDKMKLRRVDIPALYQDLTQDSVSQSFSQELTSSAVEPSAVDVSEDANPPFPKALLRKDELNAVNKESPSSITPKGSCVTNSSGLLEDKKGGERETVFTELRALEESEKTTSKRKQLLTVRSDIDECCLPILEKTNVAKGKNAGSVTNDSSLKENKAPEVRCIQSEVKSADVPSVAALTKSSDEEDVVKSPSARMASATKGKTSGLSVSTSNEKRTSNQSEPASVDVSSSMKLGKIFPQIEGSESKETAFLPGADAIKTSKDTSNKTEVKYLSEQISPSTLVPTTPVNKSKAAPLQPLQDLVENSNDLNESKKEVSDNEEAGIIVSESSKPGDALSAEMSPVLLSSRKPLRKSSRGKIPLPSTPLPTSSDSESPSSSNTSSIELRRKRGRPKKLGTPSPIAHIRKISLQQHSKRLTATKEIESTPSEENHGDGKKEDKELVALEKPVPETVSVEEDGAEIERNKEDSNFPKKMDHEVVELGKKIVMEDKTAFLSPNKSPAKVLESPMNREGKDASTCSPSLKPKFVIESPKRKSPILSGSLDDWVIVKKAGNADKGETNDSDVLPAVKSEINLSSEAVCISPPGDLVESSQEPISPAKAMTKNCSVNLSRMSGIFASESAEVAFIAYQGSVIKCNLSPSKKEEKDQRKEVNAASVATNLFPSPRSKTGRGARMLNLAQSNKEEGARSPLLDIKSPQESPRQVVDGEGGCSTPPMKKPRRIRPVQIGDVSPQYHSLEIGLELF